MLDRLNVGFRSPAGLCPRVEFGVGVETGVVVVDPADVGFVKLLEDGAMRKTKDVERLVIPPVSIGRA